jgi:hypothetical protein
MSEDQQGSNFSVSVPIGALASAAVLGAAAAAYILINRNDADSTSQLSTSAKSKSKGLRRKIGLTTVITLLENDASRKVVLAALRAMARRA